MPHLAFSSVSAPVQKYALEAFDDDVGISRSMERRVCDAIADGEVAICVITAGHRRALESRLPSTCLSLRPARARCLMLDADEVLAGIMDGCTPSKDRFRRRIGAIVARSGLEGVPVTIVCDMVGLLREREMRQASDELLSQWQMLGEQFEFALMAPCRSWTLLATELAVDAQPVRLRVPSLPSQGELDFGVAGDGAAASAPEVIVAGTPALGPMPPMRGLAERRIERMLQRPASERDERALLLVNVDRFSAVVETLGQVCAQQLLEAAMQQISATLDGSAVVDRYGNDEFVITLVTAPPAEAPAGVARRILDALRQVFIIGRHRMTLAASIGVAVCDEAGADPDVLLRHARLALQSAKRAGGDCVRSYDRNLVSSLQARFDIEQRLRQALDLHEFVLNYQPVYNLATGEVGSIEALLRWQPTTGPAVPPSQFIPVAEETGLIVPIGDWVLQTACADLATLQRSGFNDMRVAVNVSARQLLQPRIAARVQRAVHSHGIEPDRLLLELTETMLIEDSEAVAAALWSLRALGTSLALDDFGTGFASLGYLKRVPVDCIKIDQSFVRDVGADRESEAIVESIIAIGRKLRLHVIGEGVETEGQLRFLEARGCHAAQGYLLGRPALLSALVPSLHASAAIARRLSLSGAGTSLFR
jgi:diguanylate cyclase (GGDEF)-like protein